MIFPNFFHLWLWTLIPLSNVNVLYFLIKRILQNQWTEWSDVLSLGKISNINFFINIFGTRFVYTVLYPVYSVQCTLPHIWPSLGFKIILLYWTCKGGRGVMALAIPIHYVKNSHWHQRICITLSARWADSFELLIPAAGSAWGHQRLGLLLLYRHQQSPTPPCQHTRQVEIWINLTSVQVYRTVQCTMPYRNAPEIDGQPEVDSSVKIGTSSRANSPRASAVPIFAYSSVIPPIPGQPGPWLESDVTRRLSPPQSRNGAGLVPTRAISGQLCARKK